MIICDSCYVENDVKTHVPAKRHTFRILDSGSSAPGPIKDREIDLCPKCVEKMKSLLEGLPGHVRGIK